MRGMLTVALLALVASGAAAQTDPAEKAVTQVIKQYEQGLNSGHDVEMVLKTFEPDGNWMPPNQPATKGGAALRQWYLNYWSRTVAKLQFTPEVIRSQGRLAYAQVHVTGTTTTKAGGTVRQQDNKALFVLQQGTDGVWRIAEYSINSNLPAVP